MPQKGEHNHKIYQHRAISVSQGTKRASRRTGKNILNTAVETKAREGLVESRNLGKKRRRQGSSYRKLPLLVLTVISCCWVVREQETGGRSVV